MDIRTIAIVSFILGVAWSLDLGVRHEYEYKTELGNDRSQRKPFDFQVSAAVHLTSIWKNPNHLDADELIQIELLNPKLSVYKKESLESHRSKLDGQDALVLYAHRVRGQVISLHGPSDVKDGFLKNIAKGIVGFLDYQPTSKAVQQPGITGLCNVFYTLNANTLTKTIGNCVDSVRTSDDIRSAAVRRTAITEYDLQVGDHSTMISMESTNIVDMSSNLYESVKVSIQSKTIMKLQKEAPDQFTIDKVNIEDVLESLKAKYKGKFHEEKLASLHSIKVKESPNLISLVKAYLKYLKPKQLAKSSSATAFIKLIRPFSVASQEDIKGVLSNKEFKPILPQLLDIVAFTGTESGLSAALETLNLEKGDSDLIERYLISLSLVQQVPKSVLDTLLGIVNKPLVNDKVRSSLILTLGALAKTYSKQGTEPKFEVADLLQEKLLSCEDDGCKMMYLRALRNSALKSSIPFLMKYAEKGGPSTLEVLRALESIGFESHPDCGEFNERVFHCTRAKYDTSSRIAAAQMLLQCYSNLNTLSRLISSLENQSENEVSTFVAIKIMEKMEKDSKFRSDIMTLFANGEVRHYLPFAQNGASTTFEKHLFSSPTVNGTYKISMEMLPGGLLRRSLFDVNIEKDHGRLPVLSIGGFADGLGSFASGSSDDGEQQGEPVAGMELVLLGVPLRPYIFFESTSELMKHAFGGTASDPTPALQGNLLLGNSREVIPLQNGLNVDLTFQSAVSMDLSASIQISLWYRTAKSLVENGLALVTVGSASVDTDFVSLQEEFTFKGQTKIDFNLDLEFAEPPFNMCMQMTRVGFPFKVNKKMLLSIPGTKYASKRTIKKKFLVPPTSYAFHPKNNDLCYVMLDQN